MADTDSVRIWKSFTYRGETKLWSNRYHLRDTVIESRRKQLLDGVVADESGIFNGNVEIVLGEYLVAGSDVAAHTETYSTTGTLGVATPAYAPGDCAAVVRYTTDQRSTKNHPIYLFNYYHGVLLQSVSVPDTLNTDQADAMASYAATWVSGLAYGGGAYEAFRAGPRGAVAQDSSVLANIRHRDFT